MGSPTEHLHTSTFIPSPVEVAWLLAATRDRNPIHLWNGSTPPIAQGFFGIGKAYIAAAELLGVNSVLGISAEFRRVHPVNTAAELVLDWSEPSTDGHQRLRFAITLESAEVASTGSIFVSDLRPRATS